MWRAIPHKDRLKATDPGEWERVVRTVEENEVMAKVLIENFKGKVKKKFLR